MQSFFGRYASFLAATLAEDTGPSSRSLPGGEMQQTGCGLVQFVTPSRSASRLIISAGIHGNETAPIELLDRIVSDILEQRLQPGLDCLFILGNPQAMRAQERFLDTNLNRLFRTDLNPETDAEHRRASEIMACSQSFSEGAREIVHYDLHTAIRGSHFEKFAVYPFLPARTCAEQQLHLLGNSEIEALLLQNKPSTTYSSWTAAEFAAESFTVELGRVAPFGENDLGRLEGIDRMLRSLIDGTPQPAADRFPIQFQVVDEIINHGQGFELCIDEQTPNFTRFESGYEIWRNAEQSYRVGEEPLYIVFPNSKVGPGQRAGLLVKPLSGMVLS